MTVGPFSNTFAILLQKGNDQNKDDNLVISLVPRNNVKCFISIFSVSETTNYNKTAHNPEL